MISIQVLEGTAGIATLAGEWEALVGNTSGAAFARPGWHLASIDAIPRREIVAIAARDGDRLIGVLPLSRIRTDSRGLFFNLVGPPGRGDYQPFVIAPELAAQALPLMLEAAMSRYGRHGTYWFPNIPTTDPALPVLRAFLDAHHMPYTEERESAPRLRLDGADFAAVEAAWPQKHRWDVRRRRKRLAERGPLSIWQPSSVEEAEPVLDEFFRVHDDKWLAQGYPGMFHDPAQRRFFKAVLRRLWNNGAHFSTLRCGAVDVSYHFGFFSGGWIQWYRPTYRPEFGTCSPTKVHIAMLIEEACRMGWAGFDFLLGTEEYKGPWCNDMAEVVNIHAGFHRWAPSYFWFSRGKPFVRARLQPAYFRARAWWQKRRGAGEPSGQPE
jgi:CelD/BcsL family acetyltransferase involved in cellulose biosynthesis